MKICDQCANIRAITPSNLQSKALCALCGQKQMCSDTTTLTSPAVAFMDKGYFNTHDLSKLLALLKNRKAILLPRIKFLQAEISKPMQQMREGELVYLIESLADEGLTKKAVNTCYGVFKRMKDLVSKANLSVAERATKTVILQNLLAENGGLSEKEKELSILYKNALDQILLQQLRFRLSKEQFDSAYEDAKKVYNQINGNGTQKRR